MRKILCGGGHAAHGGGRKAPLCGLILGAALALGTTADAQQDSPLPPRFATMFDNTDLPGGDLTPIFNTNLAQCHSACLRDTECTAFTFNQRAGACFPKSQPGAAVPFEGALSGRIAERPASAAARARDMRARLGFLSARDFDLARGQAETMAERYYANGMTETALLDGATGGRAVLFTGAAATVADSGAAWIAHANALLAQAARDNQPSADLQRQAILAATNAALRLSDPAPALVTMADALEKRFRGEDALAAIRLAEALRPGIAPDTLTRLREQYGFRLLSHDVDSNTATPRICARFSEPLVASRDYAPFLAGDAGALVPEVDDRQLCLTGVEYGARYEIRLRAGLPAAGGDTLARDVPLAVYIRDRAPLVRFLGRGYVLPATGPRALPVETVNSDALDLTLYRVSDRNLVATIRDGNFAQALSAWEGERVTNDLAELIWQGTATLDGALNRETRSRLPLAEAGALAPGAYLLQAAVPDTDPYATPPASQWFMVSDLGMTSLSGRDGLHVVVQALSTGQPVNGAEIQLVAESNRVLGSAQTDAQGMARFPAALAAGSGASAPALLTVTQGDDMAALSLADPEFDLSDRGVEGRAAPGPVDLFIATDRGAYRPGEVIRVTALARDPQARALPGLPMIARLMRPDGVEYSRALSADGVAGGHVFALPLGADVPRGAWRLDMLLDPDAPALASTRLLVEDFLPERIDFDLSLSTKTPVDPLNPPELQINARHLFGAAAEGLTLSGSAILRPATTREGWPGYRFGRHDQRVDPQRFPLGDAVTDAEGRLQTRLLFENASFDARPYTLDLNATLLDGAARPVERTLSAPMAATRPMIGIRPAFDDTLPQGAEAVFDLALVSPDGQAMQGALTWQVDRVDTRYQWYSVDGRWNWEPVTERNRVAEGSVDSTGQITVPLDWGQYELRVTHDGTEYASASTTFAAGWYGATAGRDTPDRLAVALDQDSYRPGDTARLRLSGEGMALVSVLSDRVIDMQLVEVAGEAEITLPVTDDWGTGAYVTATLLRGAGSVTDMPTRSMGLAHAAIDPAAKALAVTLDAPDAADPRARMEVTLNAESDGPVYATLAAVDLGILTLTDFDSPDPSAHYFGQRRLGVALRDIYGRLIDARAGAMGQVRSGGDASGIDRAGPAPTEALLALFEGPITLENGEATIGFDLPAFNGTVRLMAVVWSNTGVGQASTDVLVRDPVVVQPSLPRFLTPGDTSRMRLELTHATGAAGEMALRVTGHGLGDVPDTVTLSEGERAVLDLALAPTILGDHRYSVELTTPDGRVLTRDLTLTVQRTDPEIARSSQFVLAPGESFRFDANALDGLRDGARATLVAGAGAALDLPGLVQRLTGYPYGCTEQLASGLQPLLLASGAAIELGLVTEAEAQARIQSAIDRILTRQSRTGNFGLWGAGGYDLWLDAYVTDVLTRAAGQGADVPDTALRMALDNLRNEVAQAGDLYDNAPAIAYALYVLARAGEAAIGDLRYYADTLAEKFDTALSAAQLGGALAAYGEQARADAMFRHAADLARADDADGFRRDYGTALRDRAGLLALASEADSGAVDRVLLARQIAQRGAVHELSTQEAAWSLHAAVALGSEGGGLDVDGRAVAGNVVQLYDGSTRTITNTGDTPTTVTLTAFGVPDVAPPASGNGYTISRSYYTPDGEPARLDGLRVGERLIAVLDVQPDRGTPGGRLMVDDALPAGVEIDNPNLLRAGDIRALDWLNLHSFAQMTEARSDRFLAAVDWTETAPLRLAYAVRAVSSGEFHHPAVQVEDMYRPSLRAITDTGRVTIAP
ncbi:alpha-2-macroglobulin family protein [Roseinatronobacter ekhonensis]|uniref:alpha-2-macroglobulin family protein n=1 Tax=Roseinatronobacter ekhonensis TaxID=254356 RepID=UPI001FEA3480|nr:alpha-2-macroglobulin family protein [Roseibaca ekhonensis]